MSTNKWETRREESKTNARAARRGNGGEEENKILNRGICLEKGEEKTRARAQEAEREGRSGDAYRTRLGRAAVREIRQISSSRSFLGSHFIRAKIFRGGVTFAASAGNKTQNAFETAPVAPAGALGTE